MNFELSALAEDDLREIAQFIKADESSAASRFLNGMESRFELLCDQPYIGRSRPEFGASVRSTVYGAYLIFYRVDESVVILRVLHAAMSPQSLESLN